MMDNFNFNHDFWDACRVLPGEEGEHLAMVILRYAYTGEAPVEGVEDCHVMSAFYGLKTRIDKAVAGAKSNGGGRPTKPATSGDGRRKAKSRPNGGDSASGPASDAGDSENSTFAKSADFQNSTFDENADVLPTEREREGEGEVHKPIGAGACVAGNEPDRGEVEAWFEANASGMPADRARSEAGQFLDHFAAQGWMTASGAPIVDWRPKARQWVGRSGLFESRGRGRAAPTKADPALAAYGRCDGVVGDVRAEA